MSLRRVKAFCPILLQKNQKIDDVLPDHVTDISTDDIQEQPLPNPDKALLQLIRTQETEKLQKLRKQATAYSLLTPTLSYVTPISMALMFATIISGGLPVLAALGARNIFLQLGLLSGLLTSSAGLESFSRHRSTEAWKSYAAELEHLLRNKSYAHILQLDVAEQEEYGTSQLAEFTDSEPKKIRLFLENIPNQTIERITSFIIGASILLLAVPVSLLLTLLIMPVPYFLMKRYRDRLTAEYQALGEADGKISSQLYNTLAGLSVIKSFNTGTREQQRLAESGEELVEKFVTANITTSEQVEISIFSYQVGMLTPTFVSGILVLLGKVSVTRFMVQGFMIGKLLAASGGIRRDYDLYRNANAAAHNLQKILAQKATILSGDQKLPVTHVQGRIEFDNVSFGYSNDKPILKNITLRIEPGQHVAFVGPTGSGKSTLIKLLLRFYEVQSGRILLDGHDLRALDLENLRQAIGLVSQEIYLFTGSIYDNIRYGSPNSSSEDVTAAARSAEALEFIEKLPEGIDSRLSERGQNLSGGQRQRLSIARAILKNSPVLILDEATSAIDNETEALIQQSIMHFAEGRSTLMIAHRLSTIRHADCIHVIKEGCITESGNHESLLCLNGYYAHLWRLQTGENFQRIKSALHETT